MSTSCFISASLSRLPWGEKRLGARRGGWLLAGLIVAKEIADLFLKSQLRYIRRPTPAVLLDIATDVLTGVAGLASWPGSFAAGHAPRSAVA